MNGQALLALLLAATGFGGATAPAPARVLVIGGLVAGILAVCAALAVVLRMRKLETNVLTALRRLEPPKRDDHVKRDDVVQLRQDMRSGFESLRNAIGDVPEKVVRRLPANATRLQPATPEVASAPSPRPQPREPQDAMTQLLGVANRVMQICPATLDQVRANVGSLSVTISPWHGSGEANPTAFVVEHLGACYAIPNVVKPARFPQAWFNGTDFGMNDEIQRVVALPRLRRSGDRYEVQEPGVFAK